MRRLIESWLPLREVNEDAGLEVAFRSTRAYSGPRLRNVHVWFARRPAGVARVLTLAGILGDSVQQSLFVDVVGFNAREIAKKRGMPPLLFYTTPKRSTADCWFALIEGLIEDIGFPMITCTALSSMA
jgi:adenine-specific DNA methylase